MKVGVLALSLHYVIYGGIDMRDFDNRRGGFRRDSGPQTMHKATCAECGKECEVPFKPDGSRPVYCRDCYAKKRGY